MQNQISTQLTLFPDQLTSLEKTDVVEKPVVSGEPGVASDLVCFVEKHKHRLWANEKTRDNTVARIKRFDAFDNNSSLKIADITALHIYDWLDYEKATPYTKEGDKGHPQYMADSSINRYATAMSVILSFAVEAKLRVDSPKLRYSKEFGRTRYLRDDEVCQLISFFQDRDEQWMVDLIYVGVNTGMRLSEVLSLGIVRGGKKASHWGETEIQEDCLYVPASISKNDVARYVSINPDVREACVRLSTSIGQHFTHRKFYDRMADARAKIAPNDKEFVFHTLRHTCASRMANELSMNTLIIAEQLGHKSVDTTQKYVHAKPEQKAKFAAQMTIGKAAMASA